VIDEAQLLHALEHSYRDFHAKGLDYVCLRRSERETWKLYFFTGDVSSAPEVVHPHDHRYDFVTETLCGEVENRLYRESPDGEVFNGFRYLTPLNSGGGFTFDREARLWEYSRQRYGAGRVYPMTSAEIHTIRIVRHGTVLLVIQFEDVVPLDVPTRTFCRGDAPKLDGLYRRFTADELVKTLTRFHERTRALSWILDRVARGVAA
jgi:hypothetical protein